MFDSSSAKNLKYKINFTGGEVTVNKDFMPFVRWLRSNYNEHIAQIGVNSNGSANIEYYIELIDLVDFISFSTHTEFFNEEKFFNNVIKCAERVQSTNKTIHVNVMNEYWAQDQIQKYTSFLTKKNINHSVTEIDYSYKIRLDAVPNKNIKFFKFDDC
jgi:MoaA/NifB/PqqE/SkfB family radical SAM enzyme